MTRSRLLPSALLLAAATIVASALVAPTGAAAPDRTSYDVLGDSFGSGFGVPPYSTTCGRSQSAYGVLVDGRARLDLDDFVACAGATTRTLVDGGQLAALDGDTELVLLSIGGNDIGWSQAVAACLGGTDAQCAGASAVVRGQIAVTLPGRLDTLHAKVAEAAPDARVIVTGYPRLFSPEYGAYLRASPAEQQVLNEGADQLNAALEAAATRHGFEFVDVTEQFLDHGVNAPEPWILGAGDAGAFHPNATGYDAYAAAVTSAIKPGLQRG